MRGTTLQLLVVGSFASVGLAIHVFMARVRRPFLANLESVAGEVVPRIAITAEVVAALLYAAFAAAAMPLQTLGPATQEEIENVLDSFALFLVLVAVVQVVSLRVLHRVAHNLEPWPQAMDAAE